MTPAIADMVPFETIDLSDPQGIKPVSVPKKFMTSTWHQNTSLRDLITEAKDPFKAMLYDLMYHGPLPQKEGKLPIISVWQQRMCPHYDSLDHALFCAPVSCGIAAGLNTPTG